MAELIDSYVKLLLPFDGTDGATSDIDYSGFNHVPSFVGTAQLDTAQKEFGLSSLLLDGNSDYITLPDHADWYFADGAWTIDCWVRCTELSEEPIYEQYVDNNNRTLCYLTSTNLVYKIFDGGVNTATIDAAHGMSTGTWYHIALVNDTTNIKAYVAGTSIGSVASATVPDYASVLYIGVDHYNAAIIAYFSGHIDEYRVSKGVARWTANFTPNPYPYHKIARMQVA